MHYALIVYTFLTLSGVLTKFPVRGCKNSDTVLTQQGCGELIIHCDGGNDKPHHFEITFCCLADLAVLYDKHHADCHHH